MKQLPLTPALLDRLDSGAISDTLTPGLKIVAFLKGKRVWKYARRVHGSEKTVRLTLGLFPAHSIADARAWASQFNEKVEPGSTLARRFGRKRNLRP